MIDADSAFLADLHRLVMRLNTMPDAREPRLTGIGAIVQEHLGVDPRVLPSLREAIAPHRLADADVALDALMAQDPAGRLTGVGGGQERQHEDVAGILQHRYSSFGEGPIEYASVPIGPTATREVVTFGLRLFHFADAPVAVLQRGPSQMHGRDSASLEIIAPSAETASALVDEVRRLMGELSVVRGNVVTFARDEYGNGIGRLTFLERPEVGASDIVLPDGLLDRVRLHVVGISENSQELRARGQHLKRGILLYGPPGTGKTLTVRHLLTESAGTTAILLQGGSLGLVAEAAHLARALAPAIVVLEDVDLVAMERGMFGGPQPLLFDILDALDGLDGDADIAFVLTTNRADVLEPALAQRPGRVDLAAEIPLPDAAARRRLFRFYARDLGLSDSAVEAAADRAGGVTASFAKELVRRAVLRATLENRSVSDPDLAISLDDMLTASAGLAHVLFGGGGGGVGDDAERMHPPRELGAFGFEQP